MVYLNLQIDQIADGLIAAGYSLNSQVNEAVVAVSTTQPTNATAGQLWLNSTTFALSLYNGVSWQEVGLSTDQTTLLATLAGNVYTKTEVDSAVSTVANSVASKQDTLVSGTNIKTINGMNMLGSGNATLTATMGSLNDLTDTLVSTAISGQVLGFNGTEWVNTTPASGVTNHTLLSNIGVNTHAQIDTAMTRLVNTSGINTGDEDATSIKTKLGIATLSGSNTGDQDLSGYSPTTHSHTLDSLSDVITVSATHGQVLTYFSGVNQWVPTTPSGLTVDAIGVTVQGYDATTLKSSNIGSTVQAYSLSLDSWSTISPSAKADAESVLALSGGTMTGAITGLKESVNIIANGATAVVDMNAGVNTKTITEACTFSPINVAPSGQVCSTIIELTNGGAFILTWSGLANLKWASGAAPILTAAGKDLIGLYTRDGGTTWYGMILVKDIK